MDSGLPLLGLLLGSSVASGLRVYGTVAALGLLHRFAEIDLPGKLDVLGHPAVLITASVLYVAEFVADKIPAFDSIWDAIHTFVRIPVAGALAYGAFSGAPQSWQVGAALLCGSVAASAHGLKSGGRLAVNASPEPFSNWGISAVEEVSFAGLVWLAVAHPVAAIVAAGVVVLGAALGGLFLLRLFAKVLAKRRGAPAA